MATERTSDQFRKHLKTSIFVSDDTEPSLERLRFKHLSGAI